ncbi:MAG: VTT domain-containing protein [Hyphomicrobiales bacterium]|nr:VTT domain-containing protein [Rickettsiales bacterium]MCP5362184.1 VTT domain-containing protein [Hyphomicrobiales bacterium]
MTPVEAYQAVFQDSVAAAAILPFTDEFALKVLLAFGAYNTQQLVTAAMLGSLLGAGINWVLGRVLFSLLTRDPTVMQGKAEQHMRIVARYINTVGALVIVVCGWITYVGPAMTVLAGMFRMKWWVLLLAYAITKAVYYTLYLFY